MDIDKEIDDFRKIYLGENWVWRKGQVEAIKSVIETYLNKSQAAVILNAPTGVGKSIVAMCLSWLFIQLNQKSYILTSEISLQNQYAKDFKKFNLSYGNVQGIDNYYCTDNSEKNSLGTCRIRNK